MDTTLLRRRVAAHGLRLFTWSDSMRPIDAPLRQTGILRILVCRTSHSLGNTLLITPLLQEIESIWPGAEIDIVTRNPVATQLFSNYSGVRNIYCLPRRAMRHPLQFLQTLAALRKNHYDLAIDTDPRSRTGRALLSRSNARYKLGFVSQSKRRGVTHAVEAMLAPKHAGQIPVYLLRSAMHRVQHDYPALDVRLTEDERAQGAEVLDRLVKREEPDVTRRGVIGVFANATGHKLLDRSWWRDFMPVVEAAYPGFSFVEIAPASGVSMLDSRYPIYYTSSVRKLSKVLSGLSMLVCLDCGVMHLARATGTKTAAIFTVTDSAQWGPYGAGAYVVLGADRSAEESARSLVATIGADALQPAS